MDDPPPDQVIGYENATKQRAYTIPRARVATGRGALGGNRVCERSRGTRRESGGGGTVGGRIATVPCRRDGRAGSGRRRKRRRRGARGKPPPCRGQPPSPPPAGTASTPRAVGTHLPRHAPRTAAEGDLHHRTATGCPRRPAARADNVKDRVELAGGAGGRGGTRAYNSASRAAQAGGEETHARTHARARRGGGRGSWGGRRTMLRGGDLDLPPLLSSLLRLPLRFLVSDRLRQIRVWILEPISFKPGAFRL